MDVLVARLEASADASDPLVRLVVSGEDLVERVGRFECAFAGELAGTYGLLRARDVLPPARHLLGAPDPSLEGTAGRVILLACECGEAGCWPLEARVRLEHATVTWSDFHQPHRPAWGYDGFGPFIFDRAAYEAALAEAAAALPG